MKRRVVLGGGVLVVFPRGAVGRLRGRRGDRLGSQGEVRLAALLRVAVSVACAPGPQLEEEPCALRENGGWGGAAAHSFKVGAKFRGCRGYGGSGASNC